MSAADLFVVEALKGPIESARVVGLRYVTDRMPGIHREHSGRGFRYRYPTGKLVSEADVLERIRSLAIPPAWKEVWICPDPSGHLQATGRDDRWRKQSRYHPRWRETRDETKYAHMIAFGKGLPKIRARVDRDLSLRGLPREKVLASVVLLLELSLIRVGNKEYTRENDSFGLTTLRDRHVKIEGPNLRFRFHGKSGKWHDVNIHDRRLAKVVRQCQDLPGQELFQYLDDKGRRHPLSSEDVNEYLRQVSGQDFTAKDFRTWVGTVQAARALKDVAEFHSQTQARKQLVQAIRSVAEQLGNTLAVCRKCYIHPDIIQSYMDGSLLRSLEGIRSKPRTAGSWKFSATEAAVLDLLQERMKSGPDRIEFQLRASLKASMRKRKARHYHQ